MKRRCFPFYLLLVFLMLNPEKYSAQIKNPVPANSVSIEEIISQVNIDSLLFFVKQLSGEVPVNINGNQTKLMSRNRNQPGNDFAVIYLKNKLREYGYLPEEKNFSATGKNVLVTTAGAKYPNIKYIICAHYDDISIKNDQASFFAPGADDNASGCAAVLEAARIFSKYKFDYTIVFAFWDDEEYGLFGSNAYASNARAMKDSILGVINIDMIGWDYNKDDLVEIHARPAANTIPLSQFIRNFNTDYKIGLNPVINNPGTTSSDHSPFWTYQYSAILLIESIATDFNSFYHSTEDRIYYFNIPYFEKCSKLAIGSLAKLANQTVMGCIPIGSDNPQSFSLFQNYPNPFNPETMIQFQIAKENLALNDNKQSSVFLEIYSLLGKKVKTLINGESFPPGIYSKTWDGKDNAGFSVPSGVYYYTLRSGSFTTTRQMILMR